MHAEHPGSLHTHCSPETPWAPFPPRDPLGPISHTRPAQTDIVTVGVWLGHAAPCVWACRVCRQHPWNRHPSAAVQAGHPCSATSVASAACLQVAALDGQAAAALPTSPSQVGKAMTLCKQAGRRKVAGNNMAHRSEEAAGVVGGQLGGSWGGSCVEAAGLRPAVLRRPQGCRGPTHLDWLSKGPSPAPHTTPLTALCMTALPMLPLFCQCGKPGRCRRCVCASNY